MSRLFEELKEGENFINMSFHEELGYEIAKRLKDEEYYIHYIKTKNPEYEKDERLIHLNRELKKLKAEKLKIEQSINYKNK